MPARRKSRRRRKRNLKLILFLILGLLMIGGLVYLFFISAVFQIKGITVEGAILTDTSEITEGGRGNILLWNSPVDIAMLPHVATFTIEKDYIERSILIKLHEREKSIIWCLEKSGNCFWIDHEGYIFSPAPYPTGALVIKTVRDHTERDLQLGDNVLPENLYKNLERVFVMIDEIDLPVNEVRVDDLRYEEMTVEVTDGPDVYFSLSINPEFGRSVIESLRISNEWRRIQYVDLRVENRAYYSL